MEIKRLMARAITVGTAIFLKKKLLGVCLYFKYCVIAVSIPTIMAMKTWTLL